MLEIKKVSFAYQANKIFADLNLKFNPGEITSIVGASGVGKSTLFALLSGQEFPASGQIFLNNTDLTPIQSSKRPVITMFQQESLFPHMTLKENIRFPIVSKYNKDRFKDINQEEYITQKLEEVNLAGFEDRYPETLSGGQKQRATLARSLAANPQILLLDEPFSALHEDLKYKLNQELIEIIKRNNIIALKITHDLYEAINFSDTILYLDNGMSFMFDTSEASNLNAPAEVVDYFKLGILSPDKKSYFPISTINENGGEVSFICEIISSINRGGIFEYVLSFDNQKFKYFSYNAYTKTVKLYVENHCKIETLSNNQ